MKKCLTATALALFAMSSLAMAHPPGKKWSATELATAVSENFGDLSKLDVDRPLVGKVRIVIENSLSEASDPGRFVIRSFSTFTKAEAWLKKDEHDGMPGRNAEAVKKCSKGTCTFEQNGMLHNNIYLTKITYGIRGGSAYVKTIYIVDGD